MLGIRPATNIVVTLVRHQIAHLPRNLLEIGDVSIVHDAVSSEDKRMVVCGADGASGRGADVREDGGAGSAGADT